MKLQEKHKKQSGITLVALVVTIIILIILATISIRMVIGEGGLIWQANNGKVEYRAAEVEEEVLAWKTEKKLAKYADEIQPKNRDAFIDDQASRGLLTKEEAEDAKEDGQVKIGSKVIDYGKDETPTKPEGTFEVELTVDEANTTATTIPVTTTVTEKDGGKVPEGLTYEFYKGEEKDGASSKTSTHTFNNLSETEEYTLKVVVKDANGNQVCEDTVTVGVLEFKNATARLRYTVGMTWGDFLASKYSKELEDDGTYLKSMTINWSSSQYSPGKDYTVIGNSNDTLLSAVRHSSGSPLSIKKYAAVSECAVGRVVDLELYPLLDNNEFTPFDVYMMGYRNTTDYRDGKLPDESKYGLNFGEIIE